MASPNLAFSFGALITRPLGKCSPAGEGRAQSYRRKTRQTEEYIKRWAWDLKTQAFCGTTTSHSPEFTITRKPEKKKAIAHAPNFIIYQKTERGPDCGSFGHSLKF